MQVASQNVDKYNNLIRVNFLHKKGVKGVIKVLAIAKILIIQPIIASVRPSLKPRFGNRGDKIE